MQANTQSMSKARLWIGRIISTLAILFLIMDGVMKLLKPAFVINANAQLGYHESSIVPIGIVLLVCVLIHLLPRTAVLGAILLTGYLGGAVASQARIGQPLFSHVLFPMYVAILIWGGLWLRDENIASFIPLQRKNTALEQDGGLWPESAQQKSA